MPRLVSRNSRPRRWRSFACTAVCSPNAPSMRRNFFKLTWTRRQAASQRSYFVSLHETNEATVRPLKCDGSKISNRSHQTCRIFICPRRIILSNEQVPTAVRPQQCQRSSGQRQAQDPQTSNSIDFALFSCKYFICRFVHFADDTREERLLFVRLSEQTKIALVCFCRAKRKTPTTKRNRGWCV